MLKRLSVVLFTLFFALPAQAGPIIGVSGINADNDSTRAMITLLSAAGATPVYLGNHASRNAAADIAKLDGLVVMGNKYDIDPPRYGEENIHPKTWSETETPESRARAAYEYDLMERALAVGMPVLGICGGHQRLNVLRGGTLHQHVPDLTGSDEHAQHLYNIPPFVPVVPVHIVSDSRLAGIAQGITSLYAPGHNADPTLMENSMHHQAVAELGEGLRVAAYSDEYEENGVKRHLVEAIEADPDGPLKNQFVLGVQWHPEFGASPLGGRILHALLESAKTYEEKHPGTLTSEQIVQENILSSLPGVKQPEDRLPPHEGGVTDAIVKKAVR